MTNHHQPLSPISARYLEYFKPEEFRFRWLEATGLDESLPPRANHLAARILTLWIENESTTSCYDELVRITRLSLRTVQRALQDLSKSGWLRVERRSSRLHIVLVMTDDGVESLVGERERRRAFSGRQQLNDEWVRFVLGKVFAHYGVPVIDLDHGKSRILFAKVRSIISHMTCHEIEAKKLIDELTESPPTEVRDLPGLLLSRAATHIRNYPHLGRSHPIPTPNPHGQATLHRLLEAHGVSRRSLTDS